jgi:hypothetical protein
VGESMAWQSLSGAAMTCILTRKFVAVTVFPYTNGHRGRF